MPLVLVPTSSSTSNTDIYTTFECKKISKNIILFVLGKWLESVSSVEENKDSKNWAIFRGFFLVGPIRSELDLKAIIMSWDALLGHCGSE